MNEGAVNEGAAKKTDAQGPTQIIELAEIKPQTPTGAPVVGGNMSLFHGVKVKLTVVVGQAHTTLGELLDLKESSVLKIDRGVDCPVDVMVDGNVVARGQLVVVDDSFGVRVTEIAQTVQS